MIAIPALIARKRDGGTLSDADIRALVDKGQPLQLAGENLEGANLEGAALKGANLEGANLWLADLEGANLPKLGEKLELIPPHCDPTANLYDRIHVCRGDEVEAVWPLKRLTL